MWVQFAGQLIWTASFIVATAALACVGAGCSGSRQPPTAIGKSSAVKAISVVPREKADSLRSICTKAWAKKLLDGDFAAYWNASPTERRKNIFSSVFWRIDQASHDEPISGNQCLDLLGPPDRWLGSPSGGVILLVYFYTYNGRKMEAYIEIGATGYVTSCGFNAAGVNTYGPAWHGG